MDGVRTTGAGPTGAGPAGAGPAGAGPSRRRFVLGTAATAAGLAVAQALPGVQAGAHAAAGRPWAGEDPFTLGVASGDPLPDAVVLWTRLAPRPLEPGGGMHPRRAVPVLWQVAEDPWFRRPVRTGVALARPEEAHTVHVDARGLRPDRAYHYRFRAGQHVSPTGRTRTAPGAGARLGGLAFAVASCQNWGDGYYTAYRDMAEQDLDLVVHLGDYVYESPVSATGGDRRVPVPEDFATEPVTLERYRQQYGLYKSDPDLQAAHAAFPWFVTLDDHEVDNDWAGDRSQDFPAVGEAEFRARRRAALQAYWEHMPLRAAQRPVDGTARLHRRGVLGDLVTFHVLDTRQHRTDQPVDLAGAEDPAATMTGPEQERWLLDGLTGARTRWNVVAQQTAMAQNDRAAGPALAYGFDNWDGYRVQRRRILEAFGSGRVSNPVVVTGDQHRNLVSDLKRDFDDPSSPTVGVELLGTSISSSGDATPAELVDEGGRLLMAENPHIRYASAQRGYVLNRLTHDRYEAEFRVAPVVTVPGAPVVTDAVLVVEAGRPGVQRA